METTGNSNPKLGYFPQGAWLDDTTGDEYKKGVNELLNPHRTPQLMEQVT